MFVFCLFANLDHGGNPLTGSGYEATGEKSSSNRGSDIWWPTGQPRGVNKHFVIPNDDSLKFSNLSPTSPI